jgi:two-component system NtrC family response regulator
MTAPDCPKPPLLIVEDNEAALRQLRWTFDDHALATASDRKTALARFRVKAFPVVLLDLGLPPLAGDASEGLALLREMLADSPHTKVIVVTGREEHKHALQAVRIGAYDFYRKPVDADEIRFIVERAHKLYRLEEENRLLERSVRREPLPGVLAASDAMLGVCRMVEKAADNDASVLLTGESGTGKEVLARALHARSERAKKPFVAINCAAIPANLLESELFGHERGAFTGAVRRSEGHLERAEGGTLLLDEIGDMPTDLQAKLLRFLQERVIQRVGGRSEIPLDVRIVSATHRDLEKLCERGGFREDLYYRIAQLPIEVPPLRERPEDTLLLAQHFLEKFRDESDRSVTGLSGDALSAIVEHAWPGNVREVENRIRRAVLLAEGARITVEDLQLNREGPRPAQALRDVVKRAEQGAVTQAWAQSGRNVSKASELLGISRPTLYKLLRDHGLRA